MWLGGARCLEREAVQPPRQDALGRMRHSAFEALFLAATAARPPDDESTRVGAVPTEVGTHQIPCEQNSADGHRLEPAEPRQESVRQVGGPVAAAGPIDVEVRPDQDDVGPELAEP